MGDSTDAKVKVKPNCGSVVGLLLVFGTLVSSIGTLTSPLSDDILAVAVQEKDMAVSWTYSNVFYRKTNIRVQTHLALTDTLILDEEITYSKCKAAWCKDVEKAASSTYGLAIGALSLLFVYCLLLVGILVSRRITLLRPMASLLLLPFTLTLAAPSLWFSQGFAEIPAVVPIKGDITTYYEDTVMEFEPDGSSDESDAQSVVLLPGITPILFYVSAVLQSILLCCVFCWYPSISSMFRSAKQPPAAVIPMTGPPAAIHAAPVAVVVQNAPHQYPPHQYPPQQYPPQQYSPQQYSPQQYSPQQYPPQYPPPYPPQPGYQPPTYGYPTPPS